MLTSYQYFPSSIYHSNNLEFIDSVSSVFEEFSAKQKLITPVDVLYPALMTEEFTHDFRVKDLLDYSIAAGTSILTSQGYNIVNQEVNCQSAWGQEYYKHGNMEQHVHSFGSQLTAFYFINCPENCSKLLIHDPRSGKKQIDLTELDIDNATYASQIINFIPQKGDLYITNAWLPHSFSRHNSESPFKFVHINLGIQYKNTNNVIII